MTGPARAADGDRLAMVRAAHARVALGEVPRSDTTRGPCRKAPPGARGASGPARSGRLCLAVPYGARHSVARPPPLTGSSGRVSLARSGPTARRASPRLAADQAAARTVADPVACLPAPPPRRKDRPVRCARAFETASASLALARSP